MSPAAARQRPGAQQFHSEMACGFEAPFAQPLVKRMFGRLWQMGLSWRHLRMDAPVFPSHFGT